MRSERVLAVGVLGAVAAATSVVGVAGATAAPPPPSHVGVLTSRIDGTGVTTDADQQAEADALGVQAVRLGQAVQNPPNQEALKAQARGQAVALNVKAEQSPNLPTTSAQLQQYRDDLDTLLDGIQPELLVIENEETADKFVTATPAQYLAMFRIAVEVAHDHGVEVTDGGIPFQMVVLVAWNQLRTTQGTTAADRFLQKVVAGGTATMRRSANELKGTPASDPDPYARVSTVEYRQSWKDAEALMDAFGTDPGDVPMDVVNFHWYATDDDGYDRTSAYSDDDALRDAIHALEARTGRTLVNNEVGQWGLTPEAPEGILDVMVHEEHLPWVLWYDGDGLPAQALHAPFPRPETPVLRPNGRAFASWLIDHRDEVAGDLGERRVADVSTTYADLLGRSPDPSGRTYWAVELGLRGGQTRLARTLVWSAEHDGRSVDAAYELLLGRPPDAAGRAYWTGRLANEDPEDLEADLVASPEYFSAAGGTPEAFVTQVYADLLGRAPDPGGLSYWAGRSGTAAGRRSLALSLVRALERRHTRIDAEFHRLLDRAPDAAGMAYWTSKMGPATGSIDDLDLGLTSSAEYQAKAEATA